MSCAVDCPAVWSGHDVECPAGWSVPRCGVSCAVDVACSVECPMVWSVLKCRPVPWSGHVPWCEVSYSVDRYCGVSVLRLQPEPALKAGSTTLVIFMAPAQSSPIVLAIQGHLPGQALSHLPLQLLQARPDPEFRLCTALGKQAPQPPSHKVLRPIYVPSSS